jgi:hypothetical protein
LIWQQPTDGLIEQAAASGVVQRGVLLWRPFDDHFRAYRRKKIQEGAVGFSDEMSPKEWMVQFLRDRFGNSKRFAGHRGWTSLVVVNAADEYRQLYRRR